MDTPINVNNEVANTKKILLTDKEKKIFRILLCYIRKFLLIKGWDGVESLSPYLEVLKKEASEGKLEPYNQGAGYIKIGKFELCKIFEAGIYEESGKDYIHFASYFNYKFIPDNVTKAVMCYFLDGIYKKSKEPAIKNSAACKCR